MKWNSQSTFFDYSVFVVWRTIIKKKNHFEKKKTVVDIRSLNSVTMTDAYSMSSQADITATVIECFHISVVDAQRYFFQWLIKEENRHKQTVISHKSQKQFNVTIMNFKNSSAYVQRQIDNMLRDMRKFARIFIDDIVIFFKNLEDHFEHLDKRFQRLTKYGITFSSNKSFLGYPSLVLLKQVINAFDLITSEEKLAAIVKLKFFKTLKELKTYLDFTEWMRNYVSFYVQIAEPLQQRKTWLLKNESSRDNPRKFYIRKTSLEQPTKNEQKTYQMLQIIFSKSSFLIHFNKERSFFIDVNVSKQRGFGKMIFHVKNDSIEKSSFSRTEVQSILFFSKQLSPAETRYWLTKLKVAEVVWIVKKIRHLIESFEKSSTIIFTDHFATNELINQISLNTFNTDKLNFRLIRVFQYLSALPIRIKIKFEKFHIVSNALSRLASFATNDVFEILKDLYCSIESFFFHVVNMRKNLFRNTTFYRINEILKAHLSEDITLLKMSEILRKVLKKIYEKNNQWKKIIEKIKKRENSNDTFDDIDFILKSDHVYYVPQKRIPRICISWKLKKDIFQMIHDQNHHCGYHKTYVKIVETVYIRHLSKRLRRYIKHCKKCLKNQTVRHVSYELLNSIKSQVLPFHTVIINFIVALPEAKNGMNAVFIITNKFFKRISLIFEKITWSASEWARPWLDIIQKEKWNLPRAIFSDRDSKFVAVFWKSTFKHLNVALLFTTTYHSSVDGQSERINQTLKIALKYFLMEGNVIDFIEFLSSIQTTMNNFTNVATGVFSNEILYEFKVLKIADLLNNDLTKFKIDDDNPPTNVEEEREILRKKIEEFINFAQFMKKIRYDQRHLSLEIKFGAKIYFRLHKRYSQLDMRNRKFDKQKMNPIKILEKVKKLAYKLKISESWKIHSIVFIIHLESAPKKNDSYEKEPKESKFVKTTKNNESDVYEIKKIIVKRKIYAGRDRHRKNHTEFKMKWLEWKNHHNKWMKKND